MATSTGSGIALPEPLQEDNAKSWFKRFEVCCAANGWNEAKQLLRLPTLLKGRAWAIFEVLDEEHTESYANLKRALLSKLCPDTDKDRIRAHEQLSQRRLHEERESVDELAHDLERLLDKASPDLPTQVRDKELKFHLMNALPEKVVLQLKLLPPQTYAQTISKATELLLIYQRIDRADGSIQQVTNDEQLHKLKTTLHQVSEQLTALSTQGQSPKATSYAKPPRSYQLRDIQCYNCGRRGHLARNCWNSGNGRGGIPTRRAGGAPHFQ